MNSAPKPHVGPLPTATVNDVLLWHPCSEYTRTYLEHLAAGRERFDALYALGLDIPAEDKLWLVLRPELVPERTLHLFTVHMARQLKLGDPRLLKAVEAKEQWLRGEISDQQLDAAQAVAQVVARDAAQVVARDAAWVVARDAAWVVARDAARVARDAAWAAARAAGRAARDAARDARTAAWDAAWDAAWAAAREEQVQVLFNLLEEDK